VANFSHNNFAIYSEHSPRFQPWETHRVPIFVPPRLKPWAMFKYSSQNYSHKAL